MMNKQLVIIISVTFILLSLLITPYYLKRINDAPRILNPHGEEEEITRYVEKYGGLENLWLEGLFKNNIVFYPILTVISILGVLIMAVIV